MKLTRRGNILANGRIRRTKQGFAKEKSTLEWVDFGDNLGRWIGPEHAQHYCDKHGNRFCGGEADYLERTIERKKRDIKKQCDEY